MKHNIKILLKKVTRTRLAEAAALNQLRPQWGVNYGGGREYGFVCLGTSGTTFLLYFKEPFGSIRETVVAMDSGEIGHHRGIVSTHTGYVMEGNISSTVQR